MARIQECVGQYEGLHVLVVEGHCLPQIQGTFTSWSSNLLVRPFHIPLEHYLANEYVSAYWLRGHYDI